MVGAPCAPAAVSSRGRGSRPWEQPVNGLSGAAGARSGLPLACCALVCATEKRGV